MLLFGLRVTLILHNVFTENSEFQSAPKSSTWKTVCKKFYQCGIDVDGFALPLDVSLLLLSSAKVKSRKKHET